jgi:hypothetical protein
MKITYATTKHFWERVRERELPYQQIADAIERGDKRPRYGQENLFLNINQSVTVVTHEIGRTCTLITAYPTAAP